MLNRFGSLGNWCRLRCRMAGFASAGVISLAGTVVAQPPMPALVSPSSLAATGPLTLGETVQPGDFAQCELKLQLEGELKVERNGRLEPLPLRATAEHRFTERVEEVDALGSVGKMIRFYQTARSTSQTAGETSQRQLRESHRLHVIQRTQKGTLHYATAGPLSREELELTSEHFDTLCLTGLLPNRPIEVQGTWKVGPEAIQQACLLSGVIQAELTGQVLEVTPQIVRFSLKGQVEGVEQGAQVKTLVQAEGRWDRALGRIVQLTWQQTDERAASPAGPASAIKATITLNREPLRDEPAELNAAAREQLPKTDPATTALTQLWYQDAQQRLQFHYMRDWHIVGRTTDHVILRLIDDGDFTAQATITLMKPRSPGQRMSAEEFKKLLASIPNWQPEAILEEGLVARVRAPQQLYKVMMRGIQDQTPVVQTFYLLSGPQGESVSITILTSPEKQAKISERDIAWITTIQCGGTPAAR